MGGRLAPPTPAVRWLAALLVVALISAACSSSSGSASEETGGSGDTEDAPTTGSGSDSGDGDAGGDGDDGTDSGAGTSADDDGDDGETSPLTEIAGLPDTPAGRQFEVALLAALADELDEELAEELMAEDFAEQVTPAQFAGEARTVANYIGDRPEVVSIIGSADFAVSGILENTDDRSEWAFSAAVEVEEPHRFHLLGITPAGAPLPDEEIDDLAAAEQAWSELAPDADLLIAELNDMVGDGRNQDPALPSCEPLEGNSGGDGPSMAIGSAFKLYVLGAVASVVESGDLAWDDDVTVDDAYRSLPSGQLQLADDGAEITVAQAAELMIGISDNTATDHLMALVGRPAVEQELGVLGHSEPLLNLPFLTTRELFVLKLGDEADLARYQEAGRADRRAQLEELADEPLPELTAAIESFTEPVAIDVEWLATTTDLCQAIARLDQRAEAQPEIARALRSNRGVPLSVETWPAVSFKGGSEPGVLSLTWLVQRADDRRFVVSGILNDPDQPLDEAAAISVGVTVLELLAEL